MSSTNYENQILNAIETLVNNAVSKAQYDRTIKGVISKCVDESSGKYVIKYQNSSFYAYSNKERSYYSPGSLVYVLIPGNDMSQIKTIIGAVSEIGEDYIDIIEGADGYTTIGNNIISSSSEFGLCSYTPQGQEIILYDKEDEEHALLDIDAVAALTYINKAEHILIGADFRTNLPKEQKVKGKYGIAFELDFVDSNQEPITRTYILDTDNMLGNPYGYTEAVNRCIPFEVDGENFKGINKISIFEYNFPNTDEHITNPDIFISNISLEAAERISQEEISGYSLTFRTPQGIYFDTNDFDSSSRRIESIVKVKNKKINEDSSLLQYYWFKENNAVSPSHEDYNRYGGNGWQCLNESNIVGEDEQGNPLKQWISGNYYWITTKSDNIARENTYKCVVIYKEEIVIEKEITIYNFASEYNITIESDSGIYFYYDTGSPTLTCYVNNTIPEDLENWRFEWGVTDNNNKYTLLPETENTEGMRIVKNVIYDLQLNTIVNFSTYKCMVYKNNNYIGKSSITIVNSKQIQKETYSLVIENGEQIFKYNEKGIAPNNKSLEHPQIIYPLSFTLYDENGKEIDKSAIKLKNIFWTVPTEDTMIKVSTVHGNPISVDPEEHTATYTEYDTLYFDILTLYSSSKTRNTIQLTVKYKDKILSTKTNLAFLKEGENGSNGTDFVCRIVPNVADIATVNGYPTLTYYGSGSPQLNFTPITSNVWFKVEFWHDGTQIFDGVTSGYSDENKRIDIKWDILKNKYTNILSDYSNYTINSQTGEITFNPLNIESGDDETEQLRKSNPANIFKCTITYDGQEYYATMPIITVFANDNYQGFLNENSGFRYAMYTTDGILPIYDNSDPFTIIAKYNDEDISLSTDLIYTWSTRGLVFKNGWEQQINLINKRSFSPLKNNQIWYQPIDSFNGYCVNNALVCNITQNNNQIIKIHIPIQLYLNRFGNNALNSWDGNHIEINEDGGFILAPQVGAGIKDANNAFTGVFMGEIQESGKNNSEYGLYGYHSGERTIALSAEDGSAKFGKVGKGQIVLDPSNDTAVLRSGNYQAPVLDRNGNIITPGAGLEIDLTDPHIIFGSGNFRVDRDGQVAATGFVTTTKLENGDYIIPTSSIDTLDHFIETTNTEIEELKKVEFNGAIETWIEYNIGDSTQEPPAEDDLGWSTGLAVANIDLGQFLWMRSANRMNDNSIVYTGYTCLVNQQKELVDQYTQYILTNNDGVAPDEDDPNWVNDKPTMNDNNKPYLWTRTVLEYKYVGETEDTRYIEYKDVTIDTSWNQLFSLTDELQNSVRDINEAIKNGFVKIEGGSIIIGDDLTEPKDFIILNHNGIGFFQHPEGKTGWIDAATAENVTSTWSIDGTLNMQNINVMNLVATSIANQNLVLGSTNAGGVTGDLDIYDKNANIMFETVTDDTKSIIEGFKIYKYKKSGEALVYNGYIYFSREKGLQEFDAGNREIFGNNGNEEFSSVTNKTTQQIITNKMPDDNNSDPEYGIQMIPMSVSNAGDGLAHIGVAFLKL